MEVLTWDRISMISFSAAAIPHRATGKEIKTKKPFRGRGRAFEHFGAAQRAGLSYRLRKHAVRLLLFFACIFPFFSLFLINDLPGYKANTGIVQRRFR